MNSKEKQRNSKFVLNEPLQWNVSKGVGVGEEGGHLEMTLGRDGTGPVTAAL